MYPKGNLFIPASHGRLEAIVKQPEGERRGIGLVCHPHPLGGGTMHNKVVFRAAAGLVDAGLTTIRFNFRGVGGSTGAHAEIEGGTEDARDVLNYIGETYPGEEVTLAGFSFGSRTGMEVGVNDERVNRLISIGTPVDKYPDYGFLSENSKPILFVHGDNDEFGSAGRLREMADRLAQYTDVKVKVFANCGHFFDEHLDELRETVSDWVTRQLDKEKLASNG
jgi:alpha/beta superfamily hydrolase